jgi:anti-sigma B factor antagonist
MSPFDVSVATDERDPRHRVVSLSGELDLASTGFVEQSVFGAILAADVVTVDLAALTFCDSSGLAVLIASRQKADANGVDLSYLNARPAVRRVFEVAGLTHLLDT